MEIWWMFEISANRETSQSKADQWNPSILFENALDSWLIQS